MNGILTKIRRLQRYPLRQKSRLVAVMALALLSSAMAAAQPWPLKVLVDYALGEGETPPWLQGLDTTGLVVLAAVLTLAIYAMGSLLEAMQTWTSAAAGERMVRDLATDLFDRCQRLSLRFHFLRSAGDLLSRIMGDTYCVYKLTEALLITPTQQLLTVIVIAAVAFALNPLLTMIMLATLPVLVVAAGYFGPRLKQRETVNREASARLMTHVHHTLSSVPVVQAFCAEDRHRQTYRALAEEAIVASRTGAVTRGLYSAFNGTSGAIAMALVLAVGGKQVLNSSLTIGGLLVFLQYARTLRGAIEGLTQTYGVVRTVEANVDRVLYVLDNDEEINEAENALPLPTVAPGVNSGRIAFEGVSFGYVPDVPVLHGIDLVLEAGETVALVGPTGSGKTTLASLVPRFFDPWAGRITFDGVDLRDLKLDAVRRSVAMVLQQPFLMPMTIAENIAYGRPEATREQVIDAAKAANADGFISKLDRGYDAMIGEHGATLSGGERQRLSIARAILRDAPIVILDEPTSALDIESEFIVMDAVGKLTRGRTTIVIAHRLSTARQADRVVVLDHGRIIEQGTHSELLKRGGTYARYWRAQTIDGLPEACR